MLDVLAKTAVKEGSQRLPKAWVNIFKSWDPLVQKQLVQDFDPSDIKALVTRSNNHPEEVIEFGRNYNSAVLDKSQDGLDNSLAGISEISRKVRDEEFVGSQATPQSKEVVPDERLPDQDAAEDWVREGGGRDLRIADILKVGRGQKAKPRTYEQLISEMDSINAEMKAAKGTPRAKTLKNKLKSLQGTKDQADSMWATRWGEGAETYKKSSASPEALTANLKGTEGWKASYHKSLLFHHKNMKAIVSTFHKRLAELRRLGKATDQDIIDFHRMDDAFGMESGSREGAALRMHKATHDYLHQRLMLQWQDGVSNIQPDHKPWKGGKAKPKSFAVPQLQGADIKAIWKMMQDAGVVTKADIDYVLTWSKTAEGQQGPIDLQRGLKKFKEIQKKGGVPQADNKSELGILKDRINAEEDVAKLKEEYQAMLENISEPMTAEGELLERAARNQMTPQELMEGNPDVIAAARRRQLDLETDEYGQPKPQEVSW